jgi:XrtJ-associated TM-motif-TM protein
MKKSSLLVIGSAVLLTVSLPLHAQGGCVSSPENPTVVLALVGSAGAFLASARTRIKARRAAKSLDQE